MITATAGIFVTGAMYMLIAFVIFLSVSPTDIWHFDAGRATWTLAYTILVQSVLGYLLIAYGVKHTDSSIVAASNTLQVRKIILADVWIRSDNFFLKPPMVAVLAHVIFEEDITVMQILGGLLIITGLIVVSFQKYRENKAAQLQQMILLAQEEKNNENNKEHKKKEKKVAVDKEHLLPSNPEENEMTDTSTDINIDMDEQQVPLEDDYDQQQNEGSSFSVNIVDNETEVENGRI